MTRAGGQGAEVAAAARRLAEALDLHFASARSWQVTRGALETTISIEVDGRERDVARVRPGGIHVFVRTPGGCSGDRDWVFDEASLPGLLACIADVVGVGLTLWDLRVGRRYCVTSPFHGLPVGTELVLQWIDELKPSGRDIYRFGHANGELDLYGDREQDTAILDEVDKYLEWMAG